MVGGKNNRGLHAAIAVALLASTVARAQDGVRLSGPVEGLARVDGNGTVVSPPAADEWRPEGALEPHGDPLDLDVRLRLPGYRWIDPRGVDFVRQVSLTRLPPGSLIVEYEGIQGLVVRKLQSRMRKQWMDDLTEAYEEGLLDDGGYVAKLGEARDALADFRCGGRWWERSWLDSLTPERGGAPAQPYVHTFGERIEVLRFGDLSFTNDLRGRVDGLGSLSFDPGTKQIYRTAVEARRLAREDARLRRDVDDEEDEPLLPDAEGLGDEDDPLLDEPEVRLTFHPPERGSASASWRLRFRPRMNFNIDKGPAEMLKYAELRVTLDLFLGERDPTKFLTFDLVGRYRPSAEEAQLMLEVTMLTW